MFEWLFGKITSRIEWRKIESDRIERIRVYTDGREEHLQTWVLRSPFWYTYPDGNQVGILFNGELDDFIREQDAKVAFSQQEKEREQAILKKYGLTDEQLLSGEWRHNV